MDLEFLLKRNKNEDKKDEEWEPAPILNASYFDNDCSKVICTVDGKYLGHLYIVDWGKDRPIEAIKIPKKKTTCMNWDMIERDNLLLGY